MPLPRCARDRHARVLERTNTAEHGAHLRLPWAHLCLPRPHTRMGARIHGGCRDTPTVVCPPNTYFFARSPRPPSCVLSSLPPHPPSLTPHLHPPHSAQGEGHAYCPACPAGDLRVPGAFALGTHGKDVQISRQTFASLAVPPHPPSRTGVLLAPRSVSLLRKPCACTATIPRKWCSSTTTASRTRSSTSLLARRGVILPSTPSPADLLLASRFGEQCSPTATALARCYSRYYI